MPHRRFFSISIFFLTAVVAGHSVLRGDDQIAVACTCSCCEKCSRCGQWYIVETDNFQACCRDSQATAKLLAENAETLRAKLQSKWLGNASPISWNPKCQIVLHSNLESYIAACGRGSEHTVGSSLVNVNGGCIKSRRIDLVGGRADFLTAALPHELTHVVLKDRFPSVGLPRWADEGMAMLADTDAKQQRHERDLEEGIANGTVLNAGSLLAMDDYPGAARMGVFYGQSAAVVKYLVNEKGSKQFVDFIERANANGYDSALRECYAMQSVRQLDGLWSRQFRLVAASASAVDSRMLVAK